MDLRLYPLREEDFESIIELGAKVHGENYLDLSTLQSICEKSYVGDRSCSYVMYDKPRDLGKLVGFRLTYAPGKWDIDQWCSPEEWGVDPSKVCYFKSNTIDSEYRGTGIGSHLLQVSIQAAQSIGAVAGATHIWMQSPGNSAYKYFVRNGGKLIWVWPGRWENDYETSGYICINCGVNCRCDAAEMILYFGETNE